MGLCQSAPKIVPSVLVEPEVALKSRVRRSKLRDFPLADFGTLPPSSEAKPVVSDLGDLPPASEAKPVVSSEAKPVVSDLGRTGGECIFFLENARRVPFLDAVRDMTCEAVNVRASGHPFVRAWAETAAGDVIGKVAEWPAKNCNKQPSWFSARNLGFQLAEHLEATLRIELWDERSRLGTLSTPLKTLGAHCSLTLDIEPATGNGAAKSSVSFQILDSKALPKGRKVIYFVRHGESQWNKAQSKMNLHEMARTTDHGLSDKGRKQTEALSKQIQEEVAKVSAGEKGDPALAAILKPDVVFTSPLCRALETAVIGLLPVLGGVGERQRELVFMANAKEKQNFGGLDTHCTKQGREIVENGLEELRALYADQENKEMVNSYGTLFFDTEEVQDKWWPEGQSESSQQLLVRMQEFMNQLLYSPHTNIVVVGHSLFIRSILRKFLSDDFRREQPQLAFSLGHDKLSNCGVVRAELDPSRSLEESPLVKAELVLGSELMSEGSGMLSCCSAASANDIQLKYSDGIELLPENPSIAYSPAQNATEEAISSAQNAAVEVTDPSKSKNEILELCK
ncbi:unnamed protein product [Polarella glacialis]|uniref:Uncharacterized protein n=1 Tax=Polarella glacialis TaxID=89957 RepID=A0A813FKC5_POLGL|nr:unnamed protein product [Polarella glacialis]